MGHDSSSSPLTASPLAKLTALSPLLLSGGAALLLAAMAPGAWGAADSQGLASWVPTVSALILAAPGLAISLYTTIAVWRRMTGLFEVDIVGAVTGGVSHWVAAVCLVIFSGTMTSEKSYGSLGAEQTSSAGFLFLVILASFIGCALHAGLTMVYIWAITPGRKTRIGERSSDEPDFVDQWTRTRRRG